MWQENFAPTSHRRKSNALFLVVRKERSVIGMHSDARGGYRRNFFRNNDNQVHKCTKPNCETKRVKGLCNYGADRLIYGMNRLF